MSSRLRRALISGVCVAALMPVIAVLVRHFGSAANERVAVGFFIVGRKGTSVSYVPHHDIPIAAPAE